MQSVSGEAPQLCGLTREAAGLTTKGKIHSQSHSKSEDESEGRLFGLQYAYHGHVSPSTSKCNLYRYNPEDVEKFLGVAGCMQFHCIFTLSASLHKVQPCCGPWLLSLEDVSLIWFHRGQTKEVPSDRSAPPSFIPLYIFIFFYY